MLQDENGQWCEKGKGLEEVVKNYSLGLFECHEVETGEVISCIEERVTKMQNLMLYESFTYDEVKQAAFSMHKIKHQGKTTSIQVFLKISGLL